MLNLPSDVNEILRKKILRDYAFEQNLDKIQQSFDIFLCSAGYEDRTVGFLKKSSSNFSCRQPIVFLYHPRETDLYIKNLQNLEKVKNQLHQVAHSSPKIVEVDPIDPWQFREILKGLFNDYSINPTSKVLVDVTSFTRVFLYELIKALYSSGCNFILAYTEPDDYVETMAAGVNKLVIAPSFMGKPRPNNKTFLLIFFGWETGRSKDTFDNFNSDDHIGVIGIEPIDEKHIAWQYQSYRKNKDLLRVIADVQTSPTLELEQICRFINQIYQEKMLTYKKKGEKFDFAISGFGPKVQNIAISFFALTHKDVQLVYGAPSYWGASADPQAGIPIESHGIGSSYVYGPFSKEIIDSQYSFNASAL